MVINFFGKRGSGKTTTIKGQLEDCRPPVVIIDILGNFPEETLHYDYGLESAQTTEIKDCILKIRDYHLNQDESQKIICLKTQDYNLAIDYLSACLWEINGGTLVLDEGDVLDFSEAPCFDQIIRYGRNHNVDMLFGCRRPAEISRNITAAANKFYCFGTHEWRDIEYFRTLFGEKAEELQKVEKFHGIFLNYDQNLVGTFKIDKLGKIFHTSEKNVL